MPTTSIFIALTQTPIIILISIGTGTDMFGHVAADRSHSDKVEFDTFVFVDRVDKDDRTCRDRLCRHYCLLTGDKVTQKKSIKTAKVHHIQQYPFGRNFDGVLINIESNNVSVVKSR